MVPDVVVECTGVPSLVVEGITGTGPDGITCRTGNSPRGRRLQIDMGGLNRESVQYSDAVISSVTGNRLHYGPPQRRRAPRTETGSTGWLPGSCR